MKSFGLLKTNVGLTTNIKIMVGSDYKLSLDSIESNDSLSNDKFKKVSFISKNYYDELIPYFYKDLPTEIAFQIKYNNDSSLMSDDFSHQYDELYSYGARNIINNKSYKEEFEYFAPLYINRKSLPSKFIVFRVDGPGLNVTSKENFNDELLKRFKTVKIFDLKKETPIGEWLDINFTNNKYFPEAPLEMDFRNLEFCKWNGIDYQTGGYTTKSLFIDDILDEEKEIFGLEKFIFDSYKNNKVVFPNILNFSFLFDDEPSTPETKRKWSLNRYFGFYLDDMELTSTISPYITPFLRPDVIIESGNFLYSNLTPTDPFIEGWSETRPFYIEYNGQYYRVQRFTETQGVTLQQTSNTNGLVNETYQDLIVIKYKIIADIDLTGKQNDINKNFGLINEDNIIVNYDLTSWQLDDYDNADVWLIEIDGIYHNIVKDGNDFKVFTDYSFIFNENDYEYKVAGNSTKVSFIVDFNNQPKKFNIYKIKFTDIKIFDDKIIDTEFSKFEYEKEFELTKTDETKMYVEDLESNSNPKNLDDFIFNDEVVNIPVSSEYTANYETFKIENNELSDIWRINSVYCRWVYQNSLSANDYPYLLNNSETFEDFNRTVNPFDPEPKRIERNLDYFYTFNTSTASYLHHSLHLERLNNNLIDTSFRFELDKYLNLATYSVGTGSATYSFDYFSYLFDRNAEFNNSTIKKNVKKYSEFNIGDNIIPNISLFRGIEFRIYDVEGVALDSNNQIDTMNLKTSNGFEDYKLSVLLSDNNILGTTTSCFSFDTSLATNFTETCLIATPINQIESEFGNKTYIENTISTAASCFLVGVDTSFENITQIQLPTDYWSGIPIYDSSNFIPNIVTGSVITLFVADTLGGFVTGPKAGQGTYLVNSISGPATTVESGVSIVKSFNVTPISFSGDYSTINNVLSSDTGYGQDDIRDFIGVNYTTPVPSFTSTIYQFNIPGGDEIYDESEFNEGDYISSITVPCGDYEYPVGGVFVDSLVYWDDVEEEYTSTPTDFFVGILLKDDTETLISIIEECDVTLCFLDETEFNNPAIDPPGDNDYVFRVIGGSDDFILIGDEITISSTCSVFQGTFYVNTTFEYNGSFFISLVDDNNDLLIINATCSGNACFARTLYNDMSWTIIDDWKMDKQYYTDEIVIFDDILYEALQDHTTEQPAFGQIKSAPWVTTWGYNNGTPINSDWGEYQDLIFWKYNKIYSDNEFIYNNGEYYYCNSVGTEDIWNPTLANGYTQSDVVLYKGKYYMSTTSSNYYAPNAILPWYDTTGLTKKFNNYWVATQSSNPKWLPIDLWNPSISYQSPKLVVHNETVYNLLSATIEAGEEPGVSTDWNREYSLVPDTDFVYSSTNNPVIEMNNRYYLINSNNSNSTLDNGIIVYINKKWKNILININIADNTYPNISEAERDLLYDDLYSKLTAYNFNLAMNDLSNKYGFTDYVNYVVIGEDNSIKRYNNKNIKDLPYLITCEVPDNFDIKINSLTKTPVKNTNQLKPLRYLKDNKITNNTEINYFNNIPFAATIVENEFEPKLFENYSGNKNIVSNEIYRFSGYYSPLFYDIQLFKKGEEYKNTGNYKFDIGLTDFGLIKERKVRKVNSKGSVLKLKDSNDIKSIYPMLDEFGYTTTDFFIFRSTWDYKYHLQTLALNLNPNIAPNTVNVTVPTLTNNIGQPITQEKNYNI